MTDLELLKLAARAIGHSVARLTDDGEALLLDGVQVPWNPFTDDGDAFRLAGTLELDVMHRVVGGKRVEVLAAGGPLIQEFYEGEPCAAARRAIVRAAAEISLKRATKETA